MNNLIFEIIIYNRLAGKHEIFSRQIFLWQRSPAILPRQIEIIFSDYHVCALF